jgi:hypothetical protein
MTSDNYSLLGLRISSEGLFDPYDVLALWTKVQASGSLFEQNRLRREIKEAKLISHPLLESSLKLN